MSREQFEAIRDLIQVENYVEARILLKSISDPKAAEWLKKLDKIEKRPPIVLEWDFLPWWVLATVVGWIIGLFLCQILKGFLYDLTHLELDGTVIGISVGMVQYAVLERRMNQAGWWVLATIVGFAAGKAVSDTVVQSVPGPVGFLLGGTAVGVLLGIMQWFYLRHQVLKAGWWILASTIAWAIGWSIINLVDEDASTAYIIGAFGAAVAGVITALCLSWVSKSGGSATLVE